MQPLNDLQSVLRTLRDGIAKGYWTMQDLDVPPPGYVGKNFRNLLRNSPKAEQAQAGASLQNLEPSDSSKTEIDW